MKFVDFISFLCINKVQGLVVLLFQFFCLCFFPLIPWKYGYIYSGFSQVLKLKPFVKFKSL